MAQERAELEAKIRDREEQIRRLQPEAARLRAQRQDLYDAFQERTDEIEARVLGANLQIEGDRPKRPLKRPDVKPRKVAEPWRRRDIRTRIPQVAWVRPVDPSQVPEIMDQQAIEFSNAEKDMDMWRQEETACEPDLPPEPPMLTGKVWDSNFAYTPTTAIPQGPLHKMGLIRNMYPSTRPPREVYMKSTADSYFEERIRLQRVTEWTDHADVIRARDFNTLFQYGRRDTEPVPDRYTQQTTWLGAAPQPPPVHHRAVAQGPAGAAERVAVSACYGVFGGATVWN